MVGGEREGPRRQHRRAEPVRDPVPEAHHHQSGISTHPGWPGGRLGARGGGGGGEGDADDGVGGSWLDLGG